MSEDNPPAPKRDYPGDRYAANALVSGAMLKEMIGLPGGARIHGLRWDALHDAAYILVEHPDLPLCPESSTPVTIGLDVAIQDIQWARNAREEEYKRLAAEAKAKEGNTDGSD